MNSKQKRSTKQKLLITAFLGYAMSTAMFLGAALGWYKEEYRIAYSDLKYAFLILALNMGFLVGMLRPVKWRWLMAGSVILRVILWCYWYSLHLDGNLFFAVVQIMADLLPEAFLVSFLGSRRRGIVLSILTLLALWLRVAEGISWIVELVGVYSNADNESFGEILKNYPYIRYGFSMLEAMILRCAGLSCFVLGLKRKERRHRGEAKKPTLDESLLRSAGSEKVEQLCIFCGRGMTAEQRICPGCGKEKETCPEEDIFWEAGPEQKYIDLLLQELGYEELSQLLQRPVHLELQPNWQRAMDAAQGKTRQKMKRFRRLVYNRCQEEQLEELYCKALTLKAGEDVAEYMEAAKAFARVSGYKDAQTRAEQHLEMARKLLYAQAAAEEAAGEWVRAARNYDRIYFYGDAAKRRKHCAKMLERSAAPFYKSGWVVKVAIFLLCDLMLTACFWFVSP